MTITIAYAASGDGYLDSLHSTYTGQRDGTSVSAVTGSGSLFFGRNNNAGSYRGFETFLTFSYTVPSMETVTAAYVRTRISAMLSTGITRGLRFVSYAYGSLDTGDWRTATQLAAGTELARINGVNGANGKFTHGGSDTLTAYVEASGSISVIAYADTQLSGTAPTSDEGGAFYASETSGTADDPALVFASVARSRLWPALGAQVQLSDGTWAYLESDGATPEPAVTLKHCTQAGTVTTVATLPTGDGGQQFDVRATVGAQGLALVVDGSDHLYVVGKVGNATNSLAAKGYAKGVGYTWTAQTTRTWPLVSYDAQINGVAAAYHSHASGTIMCLFSHGPGNGEGGAGGNELAYAMLDATYLRAGTGALMRDHGSALTQGIQPSGIAAGDFDAYANETGAGLDVAAGSGSNLAWGYMVSFVKSQSLGDNSVLYPGRYILNASGDGFTHASTEEAGWAKKDPSGKVRAIRTSSSTVAYLSTDADAGWGLIVCVLQYSGTNSGGVELTYRSMVGAATNMPDGPAISVAAWWDAVYNSVSNTLEIYYRDSANVRILRRTTFSLTTMLPLGNSSTVYTVAGGTAEIQAIRVARGADAATKGLVQLAVKDGSTLSLTNVVDSFNLAPNAPTLTPKSNYDATSAATFAWTFSDPNAGDTQSAYEFQIDRSDTGASIVSTGKVTSTTSSRNVTASTLANGNPYRWRVRTYDAADVVGPWSGYGTFSTATGGTVTITNPASDNPAGVITDDYLISWSVSGTTQASYRVWLKRNDTSATLADSGWVTSVATTYNVTGMLSGVEQRIEVQVRNGALVVSGTGTRLITPDYGSPEEPNVTATASSSGGYVEVVIDNPTPQGDRPEVLTNSILRRPVGGATWTVLGTVSPDGTFRDYTAASGITYEYMARGTA